MSRCTPCNLQPQGRKPTTCPSSHGAVSRLGGSHLGWVHYLDGGGWQACVDVLLNDQGQCKGQSRGKAQRIVGTVVLADSDNPALAELEKRFAKETLVWPDAVYWVRVKEGQRK